MGSNPGREISLLGIAHPVVGIYFSSTEDVLGDGTHPGFRGEELAKLALSWQETQFCVNCNKKQL